MKYPLLLNDYVKVDLKIRIKIELGNVSPSPLYFDVFFNSRVEGNLSTLR